MPATANMRKHMTLGQIYTNKISDIRILEAMAETPRELFVPAHLRGSAYVDEDLDVGGNRYLMEPLTFARLLDIANITPSDHVLVIGCLSGYPAVIASKLAAHVTAIDISESDLQRAYDTVATLGINNITCRHVADMKQGYASGAPYNVIVIHGAVAQVPQSLLDQLAINGRLVCIRNISQRIGQQGGLGKGLLISNQGDATQHHEYFDASCPLLPGFESVSRFTL